LPLSKTTKNVPIYLNIVRCYENEIELVIGIVIGTSKLWLNCQVKSLSLKQHADFTRELFTLFNDKYWKISIINSLELFNN